MEFKEFVDISMARKKELDQNMANFRKKIADLAKIDKQAKIANLMTKNRENLIASSKEIRGGLFI
ncbi:hypothetical protein OFO01_04250 [Campylobacter sp. JMF_01 NE2]|uniref:hypothetical protein n=1 Tax=unclassified Campylobacter TaxID=2593542 RepID=UPI0022E9EBB0|nr:MULTISPECIES: hypothetical protein [unclassified Campylobacter]MDA3052660.1 hypothetical protein [Campylobacter sp. JMF_03 NE3]MDA3066991.1 hypothetical protein [Campylobacter sp. JMF_01 NE2]